LHDSALRLRIFFKREGTHQYRYTFPRKVLNSVKKIERGDGAVSSFGGFSQALLAFGPTIKGFFFWVAESTGRDADFSAKWIVLIEWALCSTEQSQHVGENHGLHP
jgi:hypothetical protein